MAEVVVCNNPEPSVTTTVDKVANPEMLGNAVALGCRVPNRALYVLVASPVETISPIGALMDVLNAYGGVVSVGVAMIIFGSVVAIVADSDDKKDNTTSGDSTVALAAYRGYRPIMGTSLPLIPKLIITVYY